MKEYYYLVADYDDGSYGLSFFKSKEVAKSKLETAIDNEMYYWSNDEVGVLLADNLDVEFQDV